jgi:hypothetical protein
MTPAADEIDDYLALASLADRKRLEHANINPDTGLATDYLNVFNEIIMLMEMLPDFPEGLVDVLEWKPCSYIEHFERSGFSEKELAIAAYKVAPLSYRAEIDAVGGAINAILESTINGLKLDLDPEIVIALAVEAAARVRPMIAQASAIINGTQDEKGDISATLQEAQAAIDALLEKA